MVAIRLVRGEGGPPRGGCCGELFQFAAWIAHPGGYRVDGWNALSSKTLCLSHESCSGRRAGHHVQGDGSQADADHHEPINGGDAIAGPELDLDRLEGSGLGVSPQALDVDQADRPFGPVRMARFLVRQPQKIRAGDERSK